jgi:hypothetical protein
MNFVKENLAGLNAIIVSGHHTSTNPLVWIMFIIAMILLIASICVPYYTDSTGAPNGVYGIQTNPTSKDCLGFLGDQCGVVHAFPVLTIVFIGLTVFCMASYLSIPFLSRLVPSKFAGKVNTQTKKAEGPLAMLVPILMYLTLTFAIVTLGTQLGMPLSGGSLAEQAKNSSNNTTFKEGMALSAAGVAIIIVVVLFQIERISQFSHAFRQKFGLK